MSGDAFIVRAAPVLLDFDFLLAKYMRIHTIRTHTDCVGFSDDSPPPVVRMATLAPGKPEYSSAHVGAWCAIAALLAGLQARWKPVPFFT